MRKRSIAELVSLGICDAQGTITADKKEAVSSLAGADAFTRIYLTTPQRIIEYIAYFSPAGKIVGLTNDGGMQIITSPAPNDAMLELIRQTIGFSRVPEHFLFCAAEPGRDPGSCSNDRSRA